MKTVTGLLIFFSLFPKKEKSFSMQFDLGLSPAG